MSDTPYSSEYFSARVAARRQADDLCENCGINDSESEEQYGKVLVTHHIIPVRRFDDELDAHTPDNLRLLCPPCHMNEEFGAHTTSHDPSTQLERDVVSIVESEEAIDFFDLIPVLDVSEAELRGAVARMVSGGYLRLTVDGSVAVGR